MARRPDPVASRPQGTITRGTTATNRLRRADRWLAWSARRALRDAPDPLVVDLGYGAAPWTAVELADRLAAVRADVEVVGVEIDPERVRAAQPWARERLSFRRGGFELGGLVEAGRRPVVVRAFNVLRQYPEPAVGDAWRSLTSALAPGGLVVDGTCDETGRLATWVALDATGPRSLTLAARLASLPRPSVLAERLPKALIHRNVPGEPVHRFLADLDASWERAAAFAPFGPRQRWVAAVESVRGRWPLLTPASRVRLGECSVRWDAVAPVG